MRLRVTCSGGPKDLQRFSRHRFDKLRAERKSVRPFERERRLEGGLEQRLSVFQLIIYLPTKNLKARCEPSLKISPKPFYIF